MSERKKLFIRELAEYLAGPNQAKMSVLLGMNNAEAEQWARLRGYTPLMGYPTVDEAEKALTEFLGVDDGDQ